MASSTLDLQNPINILSFYFDDASLTTFASNTSQLSSYLADTSWQITNGTYSPTNATNTLTYTSTLSGANFIVEESSVHKVTADTETTSSFTDSDSSSLIFKGANGELFNYSEKSNDAVSDTSSFIESSATYKYSGTGKYSDSSSISYSEGSTTITDKTDDITVSLSSSGSYSNKYSGLNSDTVDTYTESDQSSDKANFSYVDGMGYKVSFGFTSKEDSSSSINGNDLSKNKDTSNATVNISNLTYSDTNGNSLKLSASITDKSSFTESTGDISSTTLVIKGMTLATSDFSISSHDIKLKDLEVTLASDIFSEVTGIIQLPSNVHDLFSTQQANMTSLIQLGDNTIKVLKNTGVTVNGGIGKDTITGLDGADTINGDLGSDVLTGGKGADIFVFNTAIISSATDKNVDTIKDFVIDTDKIQISSSVFSSVTNFTDDFVVVNKLADANDGDGLIYEQSTGKLFYDADGAGSGDAAVNFVTLTGKPVLSAADFSFTVDFVVV